MSSLIPVAFGGDTHFVLAGLVDKCEGVQADATARLHLLLP